LPKPISFGKVRTSADISSTALAKTGHSRCLLVVTASPAEKKSQQPFSFVNYAKLHFSANELPFTKDQTPAFFDRWLLIEPPYRFVDIHVRRATRSRRNPRLTTLITGEEISGILNIALRRPRSAVVKWKI